MKQIFLFFVLLISVASFSQTLTQWGTYPYQYAVSWDLPSVRIGYNAPTGMGLATCSRAS